MPDIEDREPVQPLHTETIRVESRHARWPLMLGTLVVMGLLAIPFFPRATEQARVATTTTTTTTTTQLAGRPITYNNLAWEAKGAPQAFPAGELVRVGTSKEGVPLYANPEQSDLGGGGGGGQAAPDALLQPTSRIYIKTADGRFQPLVMKE